MVVNSLISATAVVGLLAAEAGSCSGMYEDSSKSISILSISNIRLVYDLHLESAYPATRAADLRNQGAILALEPSPSGGIRFHWSEWQPTCIVLRVLHETTK